MDLPSQPHSAQAQPQVFSPAPQTPDSSPAALISAVLAPLPDALITLSSYRYIPGVIDDDRLIRHLRAEDLRRALGSADWVPAGHDVAVHSSVSYAGEALFLPMADLHPGDPGQLPSDEAFLELARAFGSNQAWIYSSGRSFHLYLPVLAPRSDWYRFAARLLLLGTPGAPAVDTRWVGHRLMAGYASLRLTARGEHYLREPGLVRVIQGDQ